MKLSYFICVLVLALGAYAAPECRVDSSAHCQDCNIIVSASAGNNAGSLESACATFKISDEVCDVVKKDSAKIFSALSKSYTPNHACVAVGLCSPDPAVGDACKMEALDTPETNSQTPPATPEETVPVPPNDVVPPAPAPPAPAPPSEEVPEDVEVDDDEDVDNEPHPHHRHPHHGHHGHHHGHRHGHHHGHHRGRHHRAEDVVGPHNPNVHVEVHNEPGRPYHKKWHYDDGTRQAHGEVFSYSWSSDDEKKPAPDSELDTTFFTFPDFKFPSFSSFFDDDDDMDMPRPSFPMPALPRLISNFFGFGDDADMPRPAPPLATAHPMPIHAEVVVAPAHSPLRSLFSLLNARMAALMTPDDAPDALPPRPVLVRCPGIDHAAPSAREADVPVVDAETIQEPESFLARVGDGIVHARDAAAPAALAPAASPEATAVPVASSDDAVTADAAVAGAAVEKAEDKVESVPQRAVAALSRMWKAAKGYFA